MQSTLTAGTIIDAAAALTPAGIQPQAQLSRRRAVFFILAGGTFLAFAHGMAAALGLGGSNWPPGETSLFLLALLAMPWFVVGLLNSFIGFLLMHATHGGILRAAPFLEAAEGGQPLISRTAVVMTIRNENPVRAFLRLQAMRDSLLERGWADAFDFFVLSDTSDAGIAACERSLADNWNGTGNARLFYRRRESNHGFKAGNIWDFIRRHGDRYDFMLPLDADSIMSSEAVVKLVRMMQSYPKLGILQSLTAGAPASSAFGRLFQFGMRHGMRCFTMGSAWWTGDCGPYWGHNALIRIVPFRDHCQLPIPSNGTILSHDQLEAALMRRGGYEVRVVPVEGGSYEDNPPTLLEFCKRDIRWCQGNIQYWRLIGLPGLKFTSRFQIAFAVLMYVGSAATVCAAGLAMALAAGGLLRVGNTLGALVFLICMFVVTQAPKLTGFASVLLTKGETSRYGGAGRLGFGIAAEMAFSALLSVIVSLRSTLFMASLLAGRNVSWDGQSRDAGGVGWRLAARIFWLETFIAFLLLATLAFFAPAALPWAIPVIAALGLSIPLAVWTASSSFSKFLRQRRLCEIPEEMELPDILRRLADLQVRSGAAQAPPSARSTQDERAGAVLRLVPGAVAEI